MKWIITESKLNFPNNKILYLQVIIVCDWTLTLELTSKPTTKLPALFSYFLVWKDNYLLFDDYSFKAV